MSIYNNFEDFMQSAINKVECELQDKYGKSILSMMNGSKEESKHMLAEIVQKSLNWPHKYEQRFKDTQNFGQDMNPHANECASSLMLNIIMSNIF